MKYIQVLLIAVFFIAAMLLGFWLVSENPSLVVVSLLGVTLPDVSVGLLLVIAFVSGLLLGLILSAVTQVWLLFKIRRLQVKLKKLQAK